MNRSHMLVLTTVLLLIVISMLAMTSVAQVDPAVATAVQQRFNGTATAQVQISVTRTVQAAFDQAVTATAAFNATVDAGMRQAVAATAFAQRTVLVDNVARSFAGSNTDWQALYPDGAIYTLEDAVPMVLVPAGCFTIGAGAQYDNEQNGSEVCFEAPFWIDRTEVTQAQFAALGGVKANANGFDSDQRPVEQITWFEARDFCALRGARLPSEAEWEYAARGVDGLEYPWGDTFVADNLVYSANSNDQTAEVGSRPAGASWVGALDMSGNVWEWTRSEYAGYPYMRDDGREDDPGNRTDVPRVLRGGSWVHSNVDIRAAYRNWDAPDNQNYLIGFRCVLSP